MVASTPNMSKVCILAAGQGTRMGFNLPKLLLPVNQISMLSHIISWFPGNTKFVIAVGWEKQKIFDFCNLVHPDVDIEFVEIDNWDGEGSGPGYSLLACEPALSVPFYLVSSDSYLSPGCDYFRFTKNASQNSILTSHRYADTTNYLTVHGSPVISWHDKNGGGIDIFTGIAGIRDTQKFFDGLRAGNGEVISGFEALDMVHNYPDHANRWRDIGTRKKYEHVLKKENHFGFLPKENEFLYFEGAKVVKYFDDIETVDQRVFRAKMLGAAVPDLEGRKGHFYAYHYVPGERLSHTEPSRMVYRDFLDDCEATIWTPLELFGTERNEFEEACLKFYRGKTKERVDSYFETRKLHDQSQWINGMLVPGAYTLLAAVPWKNLVDRAVPVTFHGDPQPENVIVTEDGCCFLDWRQNFGGSVEWGDLYYDLAKLYHALIISGEVIRGGHYSVGKTHFEFHKRSNLDMLKNMFEEHCKAEGYSLDRVRMHTALVYLNIAALYPDDYGLFLFTLGKYALNDALEGRWTI